MMEELRYPELDLEQFWKDNDEALKDNCFNPDANQVAFGFYLEDEAVIGELELPINPWAEVPPDEMTEYKKRYNDKAERIIGKRILNEDPMPHQKFPSVKLHGEVFNGRYVVMNDVPWLMSDIKTPQDLEKTLDIVDERIKNLREFILPENWYSEKKRIFEETGETPDAFWYGRRVRGPVTLATSLYGIENTIFLMLEEEDLAHRFFDTIHKVLRGYIDIFNEEAGAEKVNKMHYGYRFNDDNCCMLNAELYEEYAYPILKDIFEYTCPDRLVNCRFQHSDSAMEHLLPVLGKLDFTQVNFGPTVLLDKIRKYMPNTCVEGCLSPMTLLTNDEERIIAEVKRDCEMAKALGTRGLKIATAGSVNCGTKLTSLRAVMYGIQKYGRFD